MNKITKVLKANKHLLNADGYIQFDKSVRNESKASPLYWIDGLQLHEDDKVTAWLSSEKSEVIDPIALERMEDVQDAMLKELEHTIGCINEIAEPIKDEMLLVCGYVFKDNEEHTYNVTCEDGHAVATPTDEELQDNPNVPKQIELTYPKLGSMSDEDKAECLRYRGIHYESVQECNFSDVCMRFGEIKNAQGIAQAK